MSKYEGLAQAYADSQARIRDRADQSRTFAHKLFNGLVDYLEAPKRRVTPVPPSFSDVKEGRFYTPVGAMKFGEDNYYHMGIRLVLSDSPMAHLFRLEVRFKMDKEQFKVGLGPDSQEYTIDPESESDFNAFYDHLYRTMKDYLEGSADAFLSGEGEERGIGFSSGANDSEPMARIVASNERCDDLKEATSE